MYFSQAIHSVECFVKIFPTYFSAQDEFSRHIRHIFRPKRSKGKKNICRKSQEIPIVKEKKEKCRENTRQSQPAGKCRTLGKFQYYTSQKSIVFLPLPGKTKRRFWAKFHLYSTYVLPIFCLWYPICCFPAQMFTEFPPISVYFLPKIVPHPCYKL